MPGHRDTGPRPWICNPDPQALFCTLHGDCECGRLGFGMSIRRINPKCPLHGADAKHPGPATLVIPRWL